eukprot:scaffold1618_cov397-Prasinococcus_capsulatus_cf.AAC.10
MIDDAVCNCGAIGQTDFGHAAAKAMQTMWLGWGTHRINTPMPMRCRFYVPVPTLRGGASRCEGGRNTQDP